MELHKKHGAVVRIAPGEYSIDGVEGAKVIYGLGRGFVKVFLFPFSRLLSSGEESGIRRTSADGKCIRHHGTGHGNHQTQHEHPYSQTKIPTTTMPNVESSLLSTACPH